MLSEGARSRRAARSSPLEEEPSVGEVRQPITEGVSHEILLELLLALMSTHHSLGDREPNV